MNQGFVIADDDEEAEVKVQRRKNRKILSADAEKCTMELAETLPEGLFNLTNPDDVFTIQESWVKLFKLATSSIEIVSYHWGLRRGSDKGQEVFDTLADGKETTLFCQHNVLNLLFQRLLEKRLV